MRGSAGVSGVFARVKHAAQEEHSTMAKTRKRKRKNTHIPGNTAEAGVQAHSHAPPPLSASNKPRRSLLRRAHTTSRYGENSQVYHPCVLTSALMSVASSA